MKIAMASLLAMVYLCFYLCTRQSFAIAGNYLFVCMICSQNVEPTEPRILSNWGRDDGLSPVRPETTIWTNASLLSIEPIEMNFSEIWNNYDIFLTSNQFGNILVAFFSSVSMS